MDHWREVARVKRVGVAERVRRASGGPVRRPRVPGVWMSVVVGFEEVVETGARMK